jgi:hypothetical protein
MIAWSRSGRSGCLLAAVQFFRAGQGVRTSCCVKSTQTPHLPFFPVAASNCLLTFSSTWRRNALSRPVALHVTLTLISSGRSCMLSMSHARFTSPPITMPQTCESRARLMGGVDRTAARHVQAGAETRPTGMAGLPAAVERPCKLTMRWPSCSSGSFSTTGEYLSGTGSTLLSASKRSSLSASPQPSSRPWRSSLCCTPSGCSAPPDPLPLWPALAASESPAKGTGCGCSDASLHRVNKSAAHAPFMVWPPRGLHWVTAPGVSNARHAAHLPGGAAPLGALCLVRLLLCVAVAVHQVDHLPLAARRARLVLGAPGIVPCSCRALALASCLCLLVGRAARQGVACCSSCVLRAGIRPCSGSPKGPTCSCRFRSCMLRPGQQPLQAAAVAHELSPGPQQVAVLPVGSAQRVQVCRAPGGGAGEHAVQACVHPNGACRGGVQCVQRLQRHGPRRQRAGRGGAAAFLCVMAQGIGRCAAAQPRSPLSSRSPTWYLRPPIASADATMGGELLSTQKWTRCAPRAPSLPAASSSCVQHREPNELYSTL